jgi:hypothetical protein
MPRWEENRGLTASDLKAMEHAVIVAERAGCPLRHFLSVTPARGILPADRARLVGDIRSRHSQLMRRAAEPPIGLWVREHKADDALDAGEHAHALAWCPLSIPIESVFRALVCGAEIERKGRALVADNGRINLQIEPNKGIEGTMSRLRYISKEREGRYQGWLKKTGQASNFWKWERPAPLIGPRWSPMRGLEDLIKADASTEARLHVVKLPTVHAQDEAKQAAIAEPLEAPPKRIEAPQVKAEPQAVAEPALPGDTPPTSIYADADPMQVSLFEQLDAPAIPVLELVEAKRIRQGLSQREVARMFGINQPAYSNAVVRGHDKLGPWAMRRALEFVRLAA